MEFPGTASNRTYNLLEVCGRLTLLKAQGWSSWSPLAKNTVVPVLCNAGEGMLGGDWARDMVTGLGKDSCTQSAKKPGLCFPVSVAHQKQFHEFHNQGIS